MKFSWQLAGHARTLNSSICLVPNSVALSIVFYERFKGRHFGFTNGLQPYKLENISLDIAALTKFKLDTQNHESRI